MDELKPCALRTRTVQPGQAVVCGINAECDGGGIDCSLPVPLSWTAVHVSSSSKHTDVLYSSVGQEGAGLQQGVHGGKVQGHSNVGWTHSTAVQLLRG